jgi:hypothetical protein
MSSPPEWRQAGEQFVHICCVSSVMSDSKSPSSPAQDVGRDLILTVFPIKSKTEPPQKRCGHTFNIIGNTGYLYGGAADDMLLADLYSVDLSKLSLY